MSGADLHVAGLGASHPTPNAGEGGAEVRKPNIMDRFIDSIELIAAFFAGIVALDIFTSVLLRYFFSVQIPDSYDFGRLLLGILIFWGIAATSYRGNHITVDLVYANVGKRMQRFIDVFATLVLLFVVTVQTYTLFDKVTGHLCRQRAHLRSAAAGLAVFPGGLARRRLGGVVDRGAHLSADFSSGADGRPISDQAGRMRRNSMRPFEQRRGRHPRLCQSVRTDVAARAGRHGDGARRRQRLCLSRRRHGGAEKRRPHLDAHGDRLHVRRHPDVPADGRLRVQLRHEPRTVSRRAIPSSAISRADWASPPSPPAPALRRSRALRSPPPRHSPPSPTRKCAVTTTRNRSPPA